MRGVYALVAGLFLLFLPAQAISQDALGTFLFMFVDRGVDVTRSYGTEYTRPVGASDKVATVVTMSDKCIFEQTDRVGSQTASVKRWDFNKAFLSEPLEPTYGGFFILGEKGVFHVREYCDFHFSDPPDKCSTAVKESMTAERVDFFFADERKMKALAYFTANFCPGTKRKKTAF